MSDLETQQPLAQPLISAPLDPQHTFETEKVVRKESAVSLVKAPESLDPIFSSKVYKFFLVFIIISQLGVITWNCYKKEEFMTCYNIASFYVMYFAWIGYSLLGDRDHEKAVEAMSGFEPVFLISMVCNIYLSYKQDNEKIIQMILTSATFVLYLMFVATGARKIQNLIEKEKSMKEKALGCEN